MCSKRVNVFMKKVLCSGLFVQIIFLRSATDSVVQMEQLVGKEEGLPVIAQFESTAESENNEHADLTTAPVSLEGQNLLGDESDTIQLPVQETVLEQELVPELEKVPMNDENVATVPVVHTQEEPVIEEAPLLGIDTVALEEPQGNWLFKRIWWERGQETYEKVRVLVAQIMDYRMEFFMHRSEINRTVLDPFYAQVGFAQGQLNEVIDRVLQSLQEEKSSSVVLDVSERKLDAEVETIKDVLERFKLDVAMIGNLDLTIDKALEQLVAECNKVRSYEQEAWQSYKKIGQELSDSKARELFYYLDVHMRYIKDIQRYLQQDFARYFQNLLRQISSETERLLGVVNKLKEQGIDFKKQLTKNSEEWRSDVTDSMVRISHDEEEQEVAHANQGFFSTLKTRAGSFFGNVKQFFVKSAETVRGFFGTKKDLKVENEY